MQVMGSWWCSILLFCNSALQQPRRPRSFVYTTFFCSNPPGLPTPERTIFDSPTPPCAQKYLKEPGTEFCPVHLLKSLVWTRTPLDFGCISAEKPQNIMLRKGLVSLRATTSLKKPVSICFLVILVAAL